MSNYLFTNAKDAAQSLLEVLPTKQIHDEKWLLLALSPQAIMMTEIIAKKIGVMYDILMTEPIFAPNNPECIIAVVSESEDIVIQETLASSFGINLDFIYGEARRTYEEEILTKIYKYRKGEYESNLAGKHILFIDNGCETGMRILTAIKTAIANDIKSVYFATPVIASNTALALEQPLDELFYSHKINNFVNTSFYYKEEQKLDADIILDTLESSKNYLPFQKKHKEN